MTTPNRGNPTDPLYDVLKHINGRSFPATNETMSFTPGDPAGWFEWDPVHEGGLIYHPPAGVVADPAALDIPFNSNFVPDPEHPGGAVVLQAL